MSRRPRRDLSSIEVHIDPNDPKTGGLGSGRQEDGGGPLHGGLTLMNRFRAEIRDPAIPYSVAMTLRARGGRLACEEISLQEVDPESPPITGVGLRAITIDSYVSRVREVLGEVGGGLLIAKQETGPRVTKASGPVAPEKWEEFEAAQERSEQREKITTQLVADHYREAMASGDPTVNRRPTQAVADRLGVSRGHVSRLLTQARRQGVLGKAQRGQAGELRFDLSTADGIQGAIGAIEAAAAEGIGRLSRRKESDDG